MQLTFSNPGFPYMLESIMQFQTDAQSAFWSEPLYHFYPGLDRAHAERLPLPRRKEYIAGQLEAVYRELEGTLDEKAAAYAGAVIRGGVRFFEVALNSAGALEQIALLRKEFGGEALIGAGAVCDPIVRLYEALRDNAALACLR